MKPKGNLICEFCKKEVKYRSIINKADPSKNMFLKTTGRETRLANTCRKCG